MKKRRVSRRDFIAGSTLSAMTVASLSGSSAEVKKYGPVPLSSPINLEDLHTPALLIDLEVMEENLRKMSAHLQKSKARLRPHTKTHKCPIIAKMQMDLGAVGICCAKVSEAEVMVESGIDRVLITSPVVTTEKIARVVALAEKTPHVEIVVDHPKNVRDFHDAASAAGVVLSVLVDLAVTKRTGITPGPPALKLLEEVSKHRSLKFAGLQAYAGHVQHVEGHGKRRSDSQEALNSALDTKLLMEKAGYEVPVLSVGGTGTFDIDSEIEGVTDIQAGSYPFMDVQYRMIGDSDSEVFDYFKPSLFVLVTAISQPVPNLITVDGGYKAFASDSVRPEFRDISGVLYHWGGDEHGILQFEEPSRKIELGDKMQMIVSHCDPTVNLYDQVHPFRDGRVAELWPIAARGRSQ